MTPAKRNPHPPPNALPADFFARDTLSVARDLLGRQLIVRPQALVLPETAAGAPGLPDWLPFAIVETEAYTQDDPASHAYRKSPTAPITPRAANLYQRPGLAYVYLIYGMYYCLNVVCEPEQRGGAVLFRALEPPAAWAPFFKTHGPGRLCKALGITQAHNRLDLTDPGSPLYLADSPPGEPARCVVQSTRIGITQAADYPWRFYCAESPFVSVREKKPRPPRRRPKP